MYFNAGEDGYITAVMFWKLKFWQLSFFLNPFIAFQYHCSTGNTIWVRHWTQSAIIIPTFVKPFLKAQASILSKVQWWESLSSITIIWTRIAFHYSLTISFSIVVTCIEMEELYLWRWSYGIFKNVRLKMFLKVSILNVTWNFSIFFAHRIFVKDWQ